MKFVIVALVCIAVVSVNAFPQGGGIGRPGQSQIGQGNLGGGYANSNQGSALNQGGGRPGIGSNNQGGRPGNGYGNQGGSSNQGGINRPGYGNGNQQGSNGFGNQQGGGLNNQPNRGK